ncbi:MAG: hypothetical protein J5U17_03775 [Candidatus Methanoperedens sp.]|nr:hypothetical protein [Candidatus Methanoperedens sp.]MCE8424880.1 hypothetical protein [Candidatus Methanoperedens sp.]MCE8427198.1 hypothetical protein [Candidatus Methanoperedens sp.]
MYLSDKRSKNEFTEMKDIVVEWKHGRVKGFRSKEEAERFINHVCKKTAPGMEYSVFFYLNK